MRPRMFHDASTDAMPRLSDRPMPQSGGGADTQAHVVALGGGTGLPNVLRGLRPLLYGGSTREQRLAPRDRLVAVVATSDDGGSS
jgi:2-phospho-L-lactate transferase/gluconeogenesis factor (CofD/UPF0052 family)